MPKLPQAIWVDRFATHLAALGLHAPRDQMELMGLTLWPSAADIRPETVAVSEYGLWPGNEFEGHPHRRSVAPADEVWRTLAEGISRNAEDGLDSADAVDAAMARVAEAALRPSVLYRPVLRFDGSLWSAIYGSAHCVVGVGRTPEEACDAFDAAWRSQRGRHDATDAAK
jgi:hypothetical protein